MKKNAPDAPGNANVKAALVNFSYTGNSRFNKSL